MTRLRRPYRISETKLLRSLRAAAYRTQNGLCYWCGRPMAAGVPEDELTADHLVPLHDGGKTRAGNIVAACRECNNLRHPELNKTKEPRSLRIGEDRPSSPFDVLKPLFEGTKR